MKRQKKFTFYLGITVVCLFLFAVIGKKAGWIGREKPQEVTMEFPSNRDIIQTITANGKIQPETELKISPDVSGEIVEMAVKEGDFVDQGQLLFKIKPDNYISARDRVEASVNTAKANLANYRARLSQSRSQLEKEELSYSRMQKLWEQEAISQADWEVAQNTYRSSKAEVEAAGQNIRSAEFQIKTAEAQLKEAEAELSKTNVYAPMTGNITKLDFKQGERVVGTGMMTGTEVMRVADLERMEVKVDVNENDIIHVKLNDTALIEVDAYLSHTFKGLVTEIANSAKTTGSTSSDQVSNFEVKILILKDSYQQLADSLGVKSPFRPGMSATVDIRTAYVYRVLSVPVQAVTLFRDSTDLPENQQITKEIVWLNQSGKAEKREVSTGIQDIYYIEIRNGLSESEEVITGPYNTLSTKLEDGTPVVKVEKSK